MTDLNSPTDMRLVAVLATTIHRPLASDGSCRNDNTHDS
jgi:hypothetical protein